jgi:hypothetical protein
MKCRSVILAAILVGLPFAAQAADPPEKLPAPKVAAPAPAPVVRPEQYLGFRVDRYGVWQNYEVDRFGRFRPVVIYSPYGAYYRGNGAPFPWAPTHQLEFARKVVE